VDDQSKIDLKFCKLIQICYEKFVTNQKLAPNYIQPLLAQWLILYSYIMDVHDGSLPLFLQFFNFHRSFRSATALYNLIVTSHLCHIITLTSYNHVCVTTGYKPRFARLVISAGRSAPRHDPLR